MILRELVTLVGFQVDTAPLRQYDNAVLRIGNTAVGLYQKIDGLGASIVNFISKISFVSGATLTGIGIAGVTASSQIEQTRTSFEVMLKSAEKADILMKDLFAFEAKTPFNIEVVTRVANKLLIAKEAASNVTKQMRMLGNIAAGDANRLQSIVYVLGQVRALGYLQGQDIMQFTNALVPIREAISKVTGVEGKALQKMIEQRQITAEITQKALELIGRERAGLMEKQSQTIRGLWSSLMSAIFKLRTAIGNLFVEVFKIKDWLQIIINGINALTKFIENLSKSAKNFFGFFTIFTRLLGPVLAIVMQIMRILFLVKIGMAGIKVLMFILAPLIKGLGLMGIHLSLSMLIPVLTKLLAILGMFVLKMLIISAIITAIFVIVEDIIGYFTGKRSVIIPALIKFFDLIKSKLLEFLGMPEWIFDLLVEDTLKRIDGFFTAIIDKIVAWYYKIIDLIKQYGLVNLILGTNPATAIPHALLAPNKSLIAAGTSAAKGFLPQTTSSPMYQFLVNVNGINVTTPPGNTQQQNESIKTQTDKVAKDAISREVEKVIVRRLNAGSRG